MNAQSVTCPPDSILSDFGLGKLDAAHAETVSRHLETCEDCRQRVATQPADSFVGRLRQVRGAAQSAPRRERTYVHGESVANMANSTDGSAWGDLPRSSKRTDGLGRPPHGEGAPAGSHPAVSAPPELANHPDYELIKELGQGGMGTVYLAKNRLMDRLEVLKVISKSLLDKPGARERFLQEIRAAANLAHPNIVAAHSVFRLGDLLVFAMEYVRGQDLAQVVTARGYLPVANAAFYIHQVALGLQHAHEKGMVHRDIKPNNLMLAVEGKKHIVKILDFGLAKATSEKVGETGLTKSGQMLGTPDYIAPEQTLDAHKADIRADIYSLGCTLYFLLSGGPPFQEQSLFEILKAHHERDPKPLNLVRPEIPVELACVVAKMMAKDPTKRYQTPIEVARALGPFFKPGQTAPSSLQPEAMQSRMSSETDQGTSGSTPISPIIPPPIPVPVVPVAAPVGLAPAPATEMVDLLIDTRRPEPNRRADWWRRLPPWQKTTAIAAAGALAAVLLGIVFLVPTKEGVIRVDINDPEIEVTIKGTDIVLKQADNGHDVKISPGDKTLLIERGEFNFETNKLRLKKGETVTVTVTLLDGKIDVKQGEKLIDRREVRESDAVADDGEKGHASKRFPFEIPDPRLGRWSLEGNELVQSSLDQEMFMLLGDADSTWNDFDVGAEIQRIEGSDCCGFWFGYENYLNRNAYTVGAWRDTTREILSVINGKFTRHGSTKGSITTGKWHHIELRVRGSREQCFLDGEQILAAESDRQTRGRLALSTWGSPFRFRNIVIKAPDGKVLLEGLPALDSEPPMTAVEADQMKMLSERGGSLPTSADGQPLNFDFEAGDLRDWTADGDAFKGQPSSGDTLHARYKYLRSRHQGRFWIGGDEAKRDAATGTMTSVPFKVTQPYASFLLAGGGPWTKTCVELQRRDATRPFMRAVGHRDDTLQPVLVDLTEHLGEEIYIRICDRGDSPWEHISFDDFRFHNDKPDFTSADARGTGGHAGAAIDLLKHIDINRDAISGLWESDQQRRLLASIGARMLKLPCQVSDEYDLAFTLQGGVPSVDDVHLLLPLSGRLVLLVVDGWGKTASGLSMVDGKWANDNETTHRGAVLRDGRPNKLVCQVRKASVTVTCNGATIIDWHGDPNRLSLEFGQVAGWDGLCIGGFRAPFYISQLDFTPIDSPSTAAPAGAEPARAVAPFDAKQARGHREAWAKHLGMPLEQTNSIGMKFRLIPSGEFMMGSTPDEIEAARKSTTDRGTQGFYGMEAPRHRVKLTKPFYLGAFELTQGQYKEVMGVNPSHFAPGQPGEAAVKGLDVSRHPVDTVSWPDAIEFCNKLSAKEGLPVHYARGGDKVTTLGTSGYRLPTEAEWEYACRAGSSGRWSFGDDESELPKHGWFAPNSGGRPHAVGKLLPNAFGLYDMHGNCTEWVWDLFGGYSASDATDPTGTAASAGRMARGGAFVSPLFEVRAAGRRESAVPGYKANFNTFRVARTISSQSAAGAVRNAADTFSPGSVWKGQKTFRHGAQSPLTVSYELHVRERDGVKFKGHVFGNGPNRNRVEVVKALPLSREPDHRNHGVES